MNGNWGLQKLNDLPLATELGIKGIHIEIYVYLLPYSATKSGANFSQKVVLDTFFFF